MIELMAPANAVEIDIHDRVDEAKGIRYIGKARLGFDGLWRCLADVGGALCLVEITVRPTVVIDQDNGDEDDAARKERRRVADVRR